MKSRTDADSRVATALIGGGDHRMLGELGVVGGGYGVTAFMRISQKRASRIAQPRSPRTLAACVERVSRYAAVIRHAVCCPVLA